MRHTVCKDCADRELYCKSWCERWKAEKAEADRQYAAKRKADLLNGAFAEMAKAKWENK